MRFPDHNKAVWIPEWQWSQEYRVNDTEHSRVDTDAETYCQNGGYCEY